MAKEKRSYKEKCLSPKRKDYAKGVKRWRANRGMMQGKLLNL